MKSSSTEIKVGDQFYYWRVLELLNSSTARCLCTGCNEVERNIWFCKLLKGSIKSCGCKSKELRKQKALEKYGVENISQAKVIKQQKVETTLNNYGVAYPMQSKTIQDKSKQTLLEKFGVEHISQEPSIKQRKIKSFHLQDPSIIESTKQKLIQEYGVDNYFKDPSNRDYVRNKLKENYGVGNPSQAPTIKQKKKQRSLEKYGTEYPQQSSLLRSKKLEEYDESIKLSDGRYLTFACDEAGIINKSHAYNLFRFYGEQATLHYINNYNNRNTTDLEDRFIELMKPYFPNLCKFNKKPIEGPISYRPDFRLELNNKVLYVNVDGLYYHSELMIDDKAYHFKMRETFENNKLRLMQFRADELWSRGEVVQSLILNYFSIHKQKLYARKCEILSLTKEQADYFFKANHLMGTHSAFKGWGLTFDNELVCCIAIREFNNHIEICRFGSKLHTSVQGGFSKLLKYVKTNYKKPIISYCDLRYADGSSYKKLGFKLESITQSWQWTNLKETFSRYYCRASMDNRSLSEREYAKILSIYKIYDAGQGKFTLNS